MTPEHFDVVVVGIGICGISAAVHLRQNCPDKNFVVLEKRQATGGTWDLFRYPGIRSDSEMYIYGFEFKPWTDPKAIGDGASILAYLSAFAWARQSKAHTFQGKPAYGQSKAFAMANPLK